MARTKRTANPNAAIAYVRVSTLLQAEEGMSLDAQERMVRGYCAMRGFDLVELVVDAGVSAGKPLATRPGGRRILDAVARREVGAVLALRLDRLFRDCVDCLTTVREWEREGVALHLLDLGGQAVDTSSSAGRFMLTVLAGAAEMERSRLAERTREGMREKMERGEFTGGEAPFGWTLAADGVALVPNESEQEVMQAARELQAGGMSLRAIGRELAARGIVTRRGKSWAHPQRVAQLLAAKVAA